MLKWQKVSEDSRGQCWKKGTRECELVAHFDTEVKAVTVELFEWVSNGTPRLEPMSEWIMYSAKYGHTQRTIPTLSIEDLEFLHKVGKKILGGGE